MNKQRGKFLTVMVILAVYSLLQRLVLVTDSTLVFPRGFLFFSFLILVLEVTALAGIWQWKKWAVQLYAASTVLIYFYVGFLLKPIQPYTQTYVPELILGLSCWAIYRKWKLFN